jgi:hypothetical protein
LGLRLRLLPRHMIVAAPERRGRRQ